MKTILASRTVSIPSEGNRRRVDSSRTITEHFDSSPTDLQESESDGKGSARHASTQFQARQDGNDATIAKVASNRHLVRFAQGIGLPANDLQPHNEHDSRRDEGKQEKKDVSLKGIPARRLGLHSQDALRLRSLSHQYQRRSE